jgi:hypothetical protein
MPVARSLSFAKGEENRQHLPSVAAIKIEAVE